MSNREDIVDSMDASDVLDANESVNLDQSSLLDVSQSASIRSSRRRMKKGSAVVLNTDRLQKYIQKDSVEDAIVGDSLWGLKEEYLQKMSASQVAADPRIAELKRKSVLLKLQRWWKKTVEQRLHNYLQQGAWSLRAADKVFALFQGHRVRKLMRSTKAVAIIKAQQDVQRILMEMCSNVVGGDNIGWNHEKWEKFRVEVESQSVDNLLLRYPTLTHTDAMLAKSMLRQLLSERQKLHTLVFGGCKWRQFPPPGFWDLSAALHLARAAALAKEQRLQQHGHTNADSPARKPLKRSTMETPPNVSRAVKVSSATGKPLPGELPLPRNKPRLVEDPTAAQSTPPPGMQARPVTSGSHTGEEGMFVNRLRHSGDRPQREVDPHLLMLTPECEQAPHVPRIPREPREVREPREPRVTALSHGSQEKNLSSNRISAATSSTSAGGVQKASKSESNASQQAGSILQQAEKRRESNKGHLQLHILSGEKLMAARKGAPVRDSLGGAVPDRIPCLKVKLMLPNWAGAGGGSAELKKVYEKIKDYTVTTLNPQWGAHFTLNFPCPRAVVQTLAADLKTPYDEDGCLTDAAFESIRKALLQWWSLGVVNIEVFDGERFNQEIFMGQFDLLLNGFMVLIKKPEDLEMKGNFQLCKGKPTDRISGSIRVHAYLHPPEKTYIAELLEAGVRASQASAPVLHDKALVIHEIEDIASDNDEPARYPVGKGKGSPEQLQPPSHSSSSNNSPPDASGPGAGGSGVMYSSRFMQTLLRHSKQHGAVFEGHQPPPPPPPPLSATGQESQQHPPTAMRSNFLSRLQSNEDETEGSERFLRDPHLEESDNIRFTAPGGMPVSQLNISESARLLKEKVKQRRSGARRSAAAPAPLPSLEENEPDALARSVVIHHDHTAPAKHAHGAHHRAQSASAVTSSVAHLSRVDDRILPSSKSLKASKEQQSVVASAHRRESMADVSKRLAGLSKLQYSTEAVLDNLHHKLEAKLRLRDSHAENNSPHKSSPHKTSHHHTPIPRATPVSARSDSSPYHIDEAEDALEHTTVLQLDLEDAEMDEDADHALNMPNTAEMRRAMLTASFRSSREEEEDAPEMGAETEEDMEFHDAQDSFDEVYDDDEPFESNHESYESPEELAMHGGYEQQYLHKKQAFADAPNDDFYPQNVSQNNSYERSDEVPVMSAHRRAAPPAAQLNRKQPQNVYSSDAYEGPNTIYPDEEAEPHEQYDKGSGYDSDHSDVDVTRGAVYNDSTMSSEYSVNVQEFLSPDARHTPRRGASSSAQQVQKRHHYEHHDDNENDGGDDELIVMESAPSTRSFDEYGSPGSSHRNSAKFQQAHGLFQVRSREDLLQSSSSLSPVLTDSRVRDGRDGRDPRDKATRGSPSRSLFDISAQDEEPFQQGKSGPFTPQRRAGAEPRTEGSAQRRTPTGHVGESPRREQIRRVVLELGELDL